VRHVLEVGRTARTGVDTDSGVEPTGRIAARRTAVTPGDLETVTTPGPHTTGGKNVAARRHDARSVLVAVARRSARQRLRPVAASAAPLRASQLDRVRRMVQFRAAVMALMAIQLPTKRGELLAGVAVTGLLALLLFVFARSAARAEGAVPV
jgi:hypothetical protein